MQGLKFVSYMSDRLPWSSSARCGPGGRSALHIWFMSHTSPILWASQAFYFNCKASSEWVQLICMFVCLLAWAIGNLFSLLSRKKLGQPVFEFIELAAGLVHFHAGMFWCEDTRGWFPFTAATDQMTQLCWAGWINPVTKKIIVKENKKIKASHT